MVGPSSVLHAVLTREDEPASIWTQTYNVILWVCTCGTHPITPNKLLPPITPNHRTKPITVFTPASLRFYETHV